MNIMSNASKYCGEVVEKESCYFSKVKQIIKTKSSQALRLSGFVYPLIFLRGFEEKPTGDVKKTSVRNLFYIFDFFQFILRVNDPVLKNLGDYFNVQLKKGGDDKFEQDFKSFTVLRELKKNQLSKYKYLLDSVKASFALVEEKPDVIDKVAPIVIQFQVNLILDFYFFNILEDIRSFYKNKKYSIEFIKSLKSLPSSKLTEDGITEVQRITFLKNIQNVYDRYENIEAFDG